MADSKKPPRKVLPFSRDKAKILRKKVADRFAGGNIPVYLPSGMTVWFLRGNGQEVKFEKVDGFGIVQIPKSDLDGFWQIRRHNKNKQPVHSYVAPDDETMMVIEVEFTEVKPEQ